MQGILRRNGKGPSMTFIGEFMAVKSRASGKPKDDRTVPGRPHIYHEGLGKSRPVM